MRIGHLHLALGWRRGRSDSEITPPPPPDQDIEVEQVIIAEAYIVPPEVAVSAISIEVEQVIIAEAYIVLPGVSVGPSIGMTDVIIAEAYIVPPAVVLGEAVIEVDQAIIAEASVIVPTVAVGPIVFDLSDLVIIAEASVIVPTLTLGAAVISVDDVIVAEDSVVVPSVVLNTTIAVTNQLLSLAWVMPPELIIPSPFEEKDGPLFLTAVAAMTGEEVYTLDGQAPALGKYFNFGTIYTRESFALANRLIKDESFTKNDGYFYGKATTDLARDSIEDGGIVLDGVDDFVDFYTEPSLQITGSFTLSCKVMHTTLSATHMIISKSGGAGDQGWLLQRDPVSGKWQFKVSPTGTTQVDRLSSTTPVVNTWYTVTAVYNASAQTMNMYVDGVLNNGTLTGTVPASIFNSSVKVFAGSSYLFNLLFVGGMKDLRVYRRALSATEISALHSGAGVSTSGLVLKALNENTPKVVQKANLYLMPDSGNGDPLAPMAMSGYSVQELIEQIYRNYNGPNFSNRVARNTNDLTKNGSIVGGTDNDLMTIWAGGQTTWDGTRYLNVPHLSGSETVSSSSGTSTPTVAAGKVNFTSGTCFDLVLSDGSTFPLDDSLVSAAAPTYTNWDNTVSQFARTQLPISSVPAVTHAVFAWIRTSSVVPQAIFARYHPTSPFNGIALGTSNVTAGRLAAWFGSAWRNSGITVNDNRWHHVGYTYSSGAITFYVDGVKAATATESSPNIGGVRLAYIGLANDATGVFVGDIADVRYYATSIPTAKQIAAMVNPLIVDEAVPFHWWKMDQVNPVLSQQVSITFDGTNDYIDANIQL